MELDLVHRSSLPRVVTRWNTDRVSVSNGSVASLTLHGCRCRHIADVDAYRDVSVFQVDLVSLVSGRKKDRNTGGRKVDCSGCERNSTTCGAGDCRHDERRAMVARRHVRSIREGQSLRVWHLRHGHTELGRFSDRARCPHPKMLSYAQVVAGFAANCLLRIFNARGHEPTAVATDDLGRALRRGAAWVDVSPKNRGPAGE